MFEHLLHINLTEWVSTIGYIGIFAIIFCETGLFFGFFLPGDSLLFTAGLLATHGLFHLWLLIPALIIISILGYAAGYWSGDKLGHWFLKKSDSFFFKKKYITQAHTFFDKHGAKAILLCRLVPIIRTFCPIVAGMANMDLKRYMLFNAIGGAVWVLVMTLLGYYIGGAFPQASHYILLFALAVILISIIPGFIHLFKSKSRK